MPITHNKCRPLKHRAIRLHLTREAAQRINITLQLEAADSVGNQQRIDPPWYGRQNIDFGNQEMLLAAVLILDSSTKGHSQIAVTHAPHHIAARLEPIARKPITDRSELKMKQLCEHSSCNNSGIPLACAVQCPARRNQS